jgi:Fe-S cluster biogenesis protein NfuA
MAVALTIFRQRNRFETVGKSTPCPSMRRNRVGGPVMMSRERVESVLDRIRPMMQADGGDIELVDISGNSARVRLTGMCSGCPSAHMTLYMGVEMALREEIKEFEELQVV